MLGWALTFLVIAIIAGVLGFGGIAGASASIAQILFFIFLVLLVISVVMHLMRRAVAKHGFAKENGRRGATPRRPSLHEAREEGRFRKTFN